MYSVRLIYSWWCYPVTFLPIVGDRQQLAVLICLAIWNVGCIDTEFTSAFTCWECYPSIFIQYRYYFLTMKWWPKLIDAFRRGQRCFRTLYIKCLAVYCFLRSGALLCVRIEPLHWNKPFLGCLHERVSILYMYLLLGLLFACVKVAYLWPVTALYMVILPDLFNEKIYEGKGNCRNTD